MSNSQDPYEITQNDSIDANGSPSPAPSPASPLPPSSRSGRTWFGKATVAAALAMELYQWTWGHAFEHAPWWGGPAAIILTMLPFGVWERLGSVAITELASKLPLLSKKP